MSISRCYHFQRLLNKTSKFIQSIQITKYTNARDDNNDVDNNNNNNKPNERRRIRAQSH